MAGAQESSNRPLLADHPIDVDEWNKSAAEHYLPPVTIRALLALNQEHDRNPLICHPGSDHNSLFEQKDNVGQAGRSRRKTTKEWLFPSKFAPLLLSEFTSQDVPRTHDGLRQALELIARRLGYHGEDLLDWTLDQLFMALEAEQARKNDLQRSERLEPMTVAEVMAMTKEWMEDGWYFPDTNGGKELRSLLHANGAEVTTKGLRRGLLKLFRQANLRAKEGWALTVTELTQRLGGSVEQPEVAELTPLQVDPPKAPDCESDDGSLDRVDDQVRRQIVSEVEPIIEGVSTSLEVEIESPAAAPKAETTWFGPFTVDRLAALADESVRTTWSKLDTGRYRKADFSGKGKIYIAADGLPPDLVAKLRATGKNR